ncbi:hypothetical protein [Salinivirga cyanobacteriivorans]
MKKMVFMSVITLLLGLTVKAQQTNIVVAIAKKSTSCNSTDLGYKVYYGSSSSYDLNKKAKVDVKRMCPDWDNVESKNNEDWGTYMGTYMVIISTTTTNSSGCKRDSYGVGFGTSSNSALNNAKKHLNGRNWSWSESKYGYRIVAEKRY